MSNKADCPQRKADVLPADVPPRAGDPEVQHPGLPAEVRLLLDGDYQTDTARMEQFQKAIHKVRQVQRMRKQHG